MRYCFIFALMAAVLVFNGCKEDAPKPDAEPAVKVEYSDLENSASDVEPLVVPTVTYEDQEQDEAQEPDYETGMRIRKANGEEVFYHLELAITEKQQTRGLMFREALLETYGMMFIFEEPFTQSFWMNNVFIPLDMLFVAENGVIHHIHHMAEPMSKDMINAEQPARAVIELNGGDAKKHGIEVGDVVLHNAFTSKK